jgi:hypothetical protein
MAGSWQRRLFEVCAGLLALDTVPAAAGAQTSRTDASASKVTRVLRVTSPPTIDGRLDEAEWAQAVPISDFHQIRPGDGTPPSERTEVYLLHDDHALYIGARMYDSEPDRIAAPTARHGQGLGNDDRLVVILDPFNTGRGGYRFETNVNGVRHDALYETVNAFQSEWTAIWDTASTVFENGWTAELEIPFKSLSFDPALDSWGFNFGRSIRRRGEEMVWVSRNRSYNPSILGTAAGLSGMNQGVGLDVVPSLSVNQERTFAASTTTWERDPSLDVFYRLTPSLNASFTLNTDFSAAEVDDRQVNLTRFNLFFPEKRDFFLNDADLFEFGRIGSGNGASTTSSENNGRPFFSRRLGLSATGAPVDLEYGAKLGGRVGRWNVGAMAVRQNAFRTVDAGGAFVGRVSANVLAESSVGAIMTTGDPNSNLGNTLTGVDFRYLNTRLAGGRVLEGEAWYQRSSTEGVSGGESAYGLGLRVPTNARWRGGISFKEVGEHFNPALGFVSRQNVRATTADAGYTHFPRGRIVQTLFAGVDAERIALIDGGLQSSVTLARLLEVRTNTNEQLNVHYSHTEEVVATPFTIYEDAFRTVVVPPGRYAFGERLVSAQTGGQRTFSGGLTYRAGDFLSGTRTNVSGQFAWKQSRRFVAGLRYEINDITLPEGAFVTRLARLNTELNFSSTLYWVTLVQYDNVSEVMGINTRLRWIPKAGQESLVVLNHRMEDRDKDNRFRSEMVDLSLRLSYTFRF